MRGGGAARRIPRGRTGSHGFSLIEVLVSFTILALFVAAAFQVYATGIRSTALAGEYARAQTLARSRLDVLAAAPALAPGEETGQTTLDGHGRILRWRATVTDYPVPVRTESPDSPMVLLLAAVEVSWDAEDGSATPRRFELRALLLGAPK